MGIKCASGKAGADKSKKPYIRKIRDITEVSVWLVDGKYVRKNICEDFVNYDHHYHLSFIPKNEFWIAAGTEPMEIEFYIYRMLAERRFVSDGMNYNEASQKAAEIERHERAKSELVRKIGSRRSDTKEIIIRIHKRLLKKYSGMVKIWIVDGELVRSLLYVDFGGGGHDRVYDFIPEGEMWIDDSVPENDRKFIMLHELHERSLMTMGLDYPHSHKGATKMEDFFRHHPEKLGKAIRDEMKLQD